MILQLTDGRGSVRIDIIVRICGAATLKVAKYEVVEGLFYTKEHEWAKVISGGRVLIGITDYAAQLLHEVVYVTLPALNTEVRQMQSLGTVESVKAVSDLFSPMSGTITRVNEKLAMHPELVNSSPYGDGWLVEISAKNFESEKKNLLDANSYAKLVEKLG